MESSLEVLQNQVYFFYFLIRTHLQFKLHSSVPKKDGFLKALLLGAYCSEGGWTKQVGWNSIQDLIGGGIKINGRFWGLCDKLCQQTAETQCERTLKDL